MKTDDIFEAITDIDDKFIANAHPSDDPEQLMIAQPAPKKPLWKTLVPIAACLAVLGTAGAFGARYFANRPRSETSSAGDTPSDSPNAASKAKLTKIEIPSDRSAIRFTMDEFPGVTFRSYSNGKGLEGYWSPSVEANLAVENCIFGDELRLFALWLCDMNGDGKREICASTYRSDEEGGAIYVYDVANETEYALTGNDEYEYALAEADGALMAVRVIPGSESDVPLELFRSRLSLDMMKNLSAVKGAEAIEIPPVNARYNFAMPEYPGYSFTATYNGILLNGYEMNAVDVPIIGGAEGEFVENLYLCDLNGDGRRELCATVLSGGVKRVEVVDRLNGYWYETVSSAERMHYLTVSDGVLNIVERVQGYDTVMSGYEPLSLDALVRVLSNGSTVEVISSPDNDDDAQRTIKLAEFPDKHFIIEDGTVYIGEDMSSDMKRAIISGVEIFLADINGDGIREFCSWGSIGSGIVYHYIEVYDVINDAHYFKKAEKMTEVIRLEADNDKLYIVTSEYDHETDKVISRGELSLDMLEKADVSGLDYEEVPLGIDQTFALDDFPGFEFEVDTSGDYTAFTFTWNGDSNSVANSVTAVYISDLDGDGTREIVLNCPFAGLGRVYVYGFTEGGVGEAMYYEDGGCWVNGGEDGKLKLYTEDDIKAIEFSKSDLKPNFAMSYYYELPAWNHTIDLSGLVPELAAYNVKTEGSMLTITHNGKDIFASGDYLLDLYSIPDKENGSVVLVYVSEYDKTVCAVRLSESSAEMYKFDDNVSLKPAAENILLVNPDGSMQPFEFPENAEVLY